MSYRGVYKDGVVFLEGDVELRNGERVEVNPSRSTNGVHRAARTKVMISKSSRSSRGRKHPEDLSYLLKQRLTKNQRIAAIRAGIGSWADRPDFRGKSTLQIVAELKKQASRRGPHG